MADNRPTRRLARITHQLLAPVSTAEAPTKGVLDGIKVLDLSTVIAGPTCAAFLADLGADVIKIERPGDPDVTRAWGMGDDPDLTASPELHKEKQGGSQFTHFNRGKRAIAIDIGKKEGQAILKKMIGQVDIFLTNVRGKSLAKLGLNYEQLKDEFPKLIFAHVSAWGRVGPQVNDPGFDHGAWFARSGIMELIRSSDESPMPRQVGGIGDSVLGTQLAGFIGLALYHRDRTGKGQLVDAALQRSGIAAAATPLHAAKGGQTVGLGGTGIRETTEIGRRRTTISYCPFQAKCGTWVQFMDLRPDRGLPKIFKALGVSWEQVFGDGAKGLSWAETTAKFGAEDPGGEWLRRATIVIDNAFASKSWQEWKPTFDEIDVWYAMIAKIENVWDDVQAHANGSFVTVPDVRHPIVAVPIQLSDSKTVPRRRAPKYGEHTDQILQQFGFSDEEVKKMRGMKAVE